MRLDAQRIYASLDQLGYPLTPTLYVLSSVDSTNQFLKNIEAPAICLAETQTAGRGRFGRTWHSPDGCHIYFSQRMHLPIPIAQHSALSLVIGLAVVRTIQACSIPTHALRIKWPNDLLWQDKKLCGILIETAGNQDLIIGIGLNVNSIDTPPWCSLRDIQGQTLDRNSIIAQLIWQLHLAIEQYLVHGFAVFMPTWQQFDYLYKKTVQVTQPHKILTGCAAGITLSGQLIVIDELQQHHELSAGETSLSGTLA
jgi:BirA family biotin operon repressor/biotin-[acetyl-CoA-carboxylase] ligase